MNILFLTQVLPYPLNAGPKIRAYYVLRYLAEAGHKINLVSFTRDDDQPEYLEHLREFCSETRTVPMRRSRLRDTFKLAQALLSGRPFLIERDWIPEMGTLLKEMVAENRFDAIHADQLWMAPYALLARESAPKESTPLAVLDQHNAVYNIPRRLAESEGSFLKRKILEREASRMKDYERTICRRFNKVVWVTAEDRAALYGDETAPPDSESIIPISVEAPPAEAPSSGRTARRVTFMGGLHWPPNLNGILWFRKKIWPEIEQRVPESVLTIIGKDPSSELINGSGTSVEVTGYLPDTSTHLAETAVFIVPLLAGGGMRVKILDAWARNLPVVSTTIGAEGIQTSEHSNICLADTPEAFAEAVVEVLQDSELAAKLASGGRKTLETLYDWRTAYRAWEEIY